MRRSVGLAAVVVVIVALLWLSGRPPAQGDAAKPAGAERMRVEYVYDGDTLSLETGDGRLERVRLIGIDTPEGPGASGAEEPECGAEEAREALRSLVPVGATVWAIPDVEARDRYDRLLLYVWTAEGRLVNRELVAVGAGEAIRIGRNDAYFEVLLAAQHDAQAAGLGIWGLCAQGR